MRARYTKKDYIFIAEGMYNSNLTRLHKLEILNTYYVIFKADNPLFDYDRFYAACMDGRIRERANTKERAF